MKLSNITLCLASSVALMLSANVYAVGNDSGSLHATGQILDATCTIDSTQLNQVVDMGAISSAELAAVSSGTSVSSKSFDFNLSNCPESLTNLGARFNYDADNAGAGNYMKNTGDAGGVLLGISNTHSDSAIASGSELLSEDYNAATGGDATIHAVVNAYRVGTSAPVEGSIVSTSQVVIVYN